MTKTIPLENGYYYHVYNRGNNSEILFREEANYSYFLELLKRYISPVADVYAYCLLNNHFHLMIRIKELETCIKTPEQCFSNLFNAYTKAFNIKYNRTGKLFQERFKRKMVDSDSYFSELIFYIHSNPQKHKFLKDFRSYAYSSFPIILSDKPTHLKRDEVLKWFGGKAFFEGYHAEQQSAIAEKNTWDDFV